MWVLIQEPMKGGAIEGPECGLACWGLLPGQTYTIGRTEGDVKCPKDLSVSRSHARINVLTGGGGDKPEVMLEDVGTKYGTHLNDGILAESQRLADNDGKVSRALKKPVKLKDNDRIRFGVAYSIFRLKWVKMEVITSMLKDKKPLDSWLKEIEPGSKVQGSWTDNTTHLVMTTISLSVKVVNCLSKGVPIVTPEFFRDYNCSLKSKQKLPQVAAYTPPVSQSDSENQLRGPDISFQINKERKQLFRGKTFVFLNPKQHTDNQIPISLAGGSSILWTEGSSPNTITANHIVIQPPGSRNSQSQMTMSSSSLWTSLSSTLSSKGLVSCPHTHIYLAIVHCSTTTFCNPSRQPAAVLPAVVPTQAKQEYQVRALDTQSTLGQAKSKPLGSNMVSDTLSTKGSEAFKTPQSKPPPVKLEVLLPSESQTQVVDVDEETQDPFLTPVNAEPDVPEESSTASLGIITKGAQKRGRNSSDEDGADKITPLAKKPFSQNTNEDVVNVLQTGKENISNNSRKSKVAAINEEEDIFGLKDVEKPSKRVLSDTESAPLQSKEKRARHSSGEDDIFGFGEPKKTAKAAKTFATSTQLCKTEKKSSTEDDDMYGFEKSTPTSIVSSDVNVCTEKKKTVNVVQRPDENQNLTSGSSSSLTNTSRLDTTGFLGKGDITVKSEVKTEYTEDETAADMSELSKSMVKVTLLSMFRPDASKPVHVPSPCADQLGKPVVNFKKFKKQSLDKSRTVINLVKYVPNELNQSGINEWFNQNKDYTRREQEKEVMEKQSQDFWNFHNSQNQGKKKASNPFSRK